MEYNTKFKISDIVVFDSTNIYDTKPYTIFAITIVEAGYYYSLRDSSNAGIQVHSIPETSLKLLEEYYES